MLSRKAKESSGDLFLHPAPKTPVMYRYRTCMTQCGGGSGMTQNSIKDCQIVVMFMTLGGGVIQFETRPYIHFLYASKPFN